MLLSDINENYLFVGGYRQTSDDKEQNCQNKLSQNFNLHTVNQLVSVKHNACTCILATIRLMLAKTVFVNDNMLLYKYQVPVEQRLTCMPYYGLDGLSMHIMNTYLIQRQIKVTNSAVRMYSSAVSIIKNSMIITIYIAANTSPTVTAVQR